MACEAAIESHSVRDPQKCVSRCRGLYVSPAFEPLHMEHLDLRRNAPDKIVAAPGAAGRQ